MAFEVGVSSAPILANTLTTLITEIKTEFKRRNNQYNLTGLGEMADQIALGIPDTTGNLITAK